MSKHWYARGADRRSGGRSVGQLVHGHMITKFPRMGSLSHFLTHNNNNNNNNNNQLYLTRVTRDSASTEQLVALKLKL